MNKRLEIKFGGIGGQGVVYAANLLGLALSHKKGYVAVSVSYGPESRGSVTTSELVYSDKPIDYPYTEGIDMFVAMHQEAYDQYAVKVRPKGLIISDSSLVCERTTHNAQRTTHYRLPASDLADTKVNNVTMANLILVGALVQITKIITPAECLRALKEFASAKLFPTSRTALELGLKYKF